MKTKDIEHVQVIKVSKLRRTLEWLGYELVEKIPRYLVFQMVSVSYHERRIYP